MNRIVVREHLSAGDLPDELRGEIPPDATVTVTVREEAVAAADDRDADPEAAAAERRFEAMRSLLARKPRGLTTTTEEAVARIRALRDEWDE